MSLLTGLIWAWAIMVFGSIGLGLFAVWTLDHGKGRAVDANVVALNRFADAVGMRHEIAQMRSQLTALKVLLLLALVILAALLVKVYGVNL
jgi:hypothetical protein